MTSAATLGEVVADGVDVDAMGYPEWEGGLKDADEISAFAEAAKRRAADVEATLDALLPPSTGEEARVVEAMRYATLGGGKRLRAFLVCESAALFDIDPSAARRVAAAIECMHAYSLVHDDLPCMDDDDTRRGRPTTHIAFDYATAVLAGDALQTRAFEILAEPPTAPNASVRAELVLRLARASGAEGMVGGQMIDILAEQALERGGGPLDLAQTERLQRLKTGALFEFSATAGAVLAEQSDAPLARYAAALGLVFQIRDDLIDVEGDEEAAGKRLRKDAEAGKATFVSLLGIDGARTRAAELVAAAHEALSPYGDRAALLRDAADFALHRTR